MTINDPVYPVIISLEPIFLYIFNDSKTCDNEGSEFEIKIQYRHKFSRF